jgi:cytochrome c553
VVKRNSVRVRLARIAGLACVACAGFAVTVARADDAAPEHAPDTMQARVMGCAACHGGQGQGTDNDYFPRLAGKPAGYLYNQLIAFRDGGRKYPPMNYLLAYMPDAYLQQIADYFSTQRPPAREPETPRVDAQTLNYGQQLVMHGDASRKVPACVSCHGAALTGMNPAIPGLVGLHADYISAQLGASRYGTRHTAAPDCMHTITSHLSEKDITAVAAYLASLPVPPDPSPVAKGSLTMPLACSSQPN